MQDSNQTKNVCIIGAGLSGLLAAKESIACGLNPTVFEKTSNLGGIWHPVTGGTWTNMRTNGSRFHCAFSDFPWPEGIPLFPSAAQVYQHFCNYSAHFSLNKHIKFNTPVIKAQNKDRRWLITYLENNEKVQATFDFMIVAVGIYSKPHFPTIEGRDLFKGKIIHGYEYRSADKIEGEKIVVVGGAFSGAEIASDICVNSDKMVTTIIPHPLWIFPRYISDTSLEKKPEMPVDFVFYKRKSGDLPSTGFSEEENKKKNAAFSGLSNQAEVNTELQVDPTKPPKFTVSDDFLENIKTRRIVFQKGFITKIDRDGVWLNNGNYVESDCVIFGTGYTLDLSFLEQDVLQKLSYDPEDQFQPLLLHKCTFHPSLENIAFVGVYRGPYFAVMDLQARWAALVFSGKERKPTYEEMKEGIEEELKIREQIPKPQFPHEDYVEFVDSLAKEVKVLPDFEELKTKNETLYNKLMDNLILPAHYRLQGPGKNYDLAIKQIDEFIKTSEEIQSRKKD